MNFRKVYRQTIDDPNWVMPFGKFRGESIASLIEIAPEYLEWCISQDILDFDHKLIDMLEERNPWMATT